MATNYVEPRDGGYYISGSRVSLDSVVYAYLRGESMLGIVESFAALSLNQVTSAVDFYVANREMVDEYLRQEEEQFELMQAESRQRHPAIYATLEKALEERQAARH